MIIDGKSLTPSQAKPVNEQINIAWGNAHAIYTESPSVFLELCNGDPDSVEVQFGGDTWHVHDRKSPTPAFHEKPIVGTDGKVVGRNITDVAYRPLYLAAAKLSPIDRIEQTNDMHLVVTALKLAAAESENHGHSEQAAEFRRLYQELDF